MAKQAEREKRAAARDDLKVMKKEERENYKAQAKVDPIIKAKEWVKSIHRVLEKAMEYQEKADRAELVPFHKSLSESFGAQVVRITTSKESIEQGLLKKAPASEMQAHLDAAKVEIEHLTKGVKGFNSVYAIHYKKRA